MEDIAYDQKKLPEYLQANMSDEEVAVYENFPESKKHDIGHLSQQQQTAWRNLHHEIVLEKKRKADLENALLNDNLRGENLVTAYALLESANRSLMALYAQEENLLCPQKPVGEQSNPFYDRSARPGVVSIRPTYKGTPTPPVVRRKR